MPGVVSGTDRLPERRTVGRPAAPGSPANTFRRATALVPDAVPLLDNIPRRPYLGPGALDRDHFRSAEPVIMTGLFAGAELSRWGAPSRARAELADVKLPVTPNPVQRLVQGKSPAEPKWTTFGRFYDLLAAGRAGGIICAEHPLPDPVAARVPDLPHLQVGSEHDVPGADMFLSGAGNVTHLHVDRGLRHNLVHQVFGRKRYILVSAAQSAKLTLGAAPAALYASTLFLDHFSREDLAGFLRYVDAWECVLSPGETLLIPATTWHYVEYVDVAFSVHLRLRRHDHLHRLAELAHELNTFSPELLALGRALLDNVVSGPLGDKVLSTLTSALGALPAASTRDDRIVRFHQTCLRLCAHLDLPVARRPHHLADIQRRLTLVS